jgi:hypothetical protein
VPLGAGGEHHSPTHRVASHDPLRRCHGRREERRVSGSSFAETCCGGARACVCVRGGHMSRLVQRLVEQDGVNSRAAGLSLPTRMPVRHADRLPHKVNAQRARLRAETFSCRHDAQAR